jgi:putative hydrolase of the HAD superfamily
MKPDAVLCDFGGTLVEEAGYDLHAGNKWVLSRASVLPAHVSLDAVVARAQEITRLVMARREETQVETPWPAAARLIYDHFGVQFEDAFADLELGFWLTSVRTRALPGVRETLDRLASDGIRMAVVSNTSFTERTLRAELDKHGLADYFEFILTSAEYSVRKPNPLLFEMAATRLGVAASSIWFVGDRPDADVAGANGAGMTSVLLGTPAAGAPITHTPAISLADWHAWPDWT